MRLGCIADDYTGATDLSSMLVRAGLRVVQVFGPESQVELTGADAVVISLKSRSIPAAEAVAESLRALRYLQSAGVQRYFFKYCSTFDSTPAGNIGPVAEALADALGVERIWYCPSFPENGRTVYCGHMFVNGVPLNESGMKDHPLNPMTDSSLVRVLQAQCRDRVDVLRLDELRDDHAERCRQPDAARHWIIDAISDSDLRRIAQLARHATLLTGGSAIARFWAEVIVDQEQCSQQADPDTAPLPAGASVVLAGSCSLATRRQIEAFAASSRPVWKLDVVAAAQGEDAYSLVVDQTVARCLQDPPALIASGLDAGDVAATVAKIGGPRAAALTESLFGAIARKLVSQGVNRIVVAGGETSGAVIAALGIDAIRIGEEIAPGVPCVHTLRTPRLSLALKSGNFGGVNFFTEAVRKLA